MIETLNKYLIQHKSINIPGLGTIFIENLPAVFDVINKRILPPHHEFRFNKYFDTPDKEFFTYLSYEIGIPDYEAIREYNQFAEGLRDSIKLEDKAEWRDVGIFSKNSAGDIIFESQHNINSLYAPVAAVRVLRDKAAHAVLVGDQEMTNVEMSGLLSEEKPQTQRATWWMYALLVIVIALLFIVYHFYNNGFTVASTANKQAVELNGTGSR